MKIRIKSPPYHSASGGVKVLHYLGYLCSKLGHAVDMTSGILNPDWGNYHQSLTDVDVTIYPESYPWSDKSEGKIVRWVLYFPGKIGSGQTTYPGHEMVVSYMPEYTESARFAAQGRPVIEFYLPFIELPGIEEIYDRNIAGAYWVGKGQRKDLPELQGLKEITRGWPTPRIELIRFLKKCQAFYSFDKFTALNHEAYMCGCLAYLFDYSKNEWALYQPSNINVEIMNFEHDLQLTRDFLLNVDQYFSVNS